jgi:hypothetical protein
METIRRLYTVEERSERARKNALTQGKEKLSERARKTKLQQTPERRREIALLAVAARKPRVYSEEDKKKQSEAQLKRWAKLSIDQRRAITANGLSVMNSNFRKSPS